MSNNTVSLKCEIKKELERLNYKKMLLVFLSLGLMGVASVAGILFFFGVPLKYFVGILLPVAGASMTMTALPTVLMLGIAIGFAIGRYYKPKVMQYVHAPNEIELVKDGLITLGAFITTIENTVNAKRIASVLYNISKRFHKIESRLTRVEDNEVNYNRIIAEQRRTIFDLNLRVRKTETQLKEKEIASTEDQETKKLQYDLQMALSRIAKSEQTITELQEEIRKLKGDK